MKLKKFGELHIKVYDLDIEQRYEVQIFVGETKDEFATLMMAAEVLTHLVAQKSHAGYEKALDLIREGAMTFEITERPDRLEAT